MAIDYRQRFLIEYFKEMRAEINLRIRNHTTFVTAKVVAAGGLLSFMLTEDVKQFPEVKSLGFVIVPIVSMLYDIMIAKNIQNIHKIGMFIKEVFEEKELNLKLWESFAGQLNVKTRCYGITDVVFLSLFTLSTVAISLFILWRNEGVTLTSLVGIPLVVILIIVVFTIKRDILYSREDYDADQVKTDKR